MTKHFDYTKFSLEMRLKQAEYRLTVTSAAKEIGISKATLSRINRQSFLPDIETYFACIKWLNSSPSKYIL